MTIQSRRDFFKTAAIGAVGAATVVQTASATAAVPSAKGSYDVIIVGAGCGGMVCAVRAAQNGLKPLLIEKMRDCAGNTVFAAGFLLGVNSKMQAGKDLPADSVEAFYEDMMKVSQNKGDKVLTRMVAEKSTSTLEWMQEYCGVKFITGAKFVWPMLGRTHIVTGKVKPGGRQLALDLKAKLKELNVPVLFSTKVMRLIEDEKSGAITGVTVSTKKGLMDIHSTFGVVLATGGFSANQQMVTQYIGSAGARMPIRGSRIIAGENIQLVAPYYAKVVNVDQYHCGPIYGPTGANPLNIVNNGVCVDLETSKRFVDEGKTYVQMAREVAANTKNNWAMMIVDADTHALPFLGNDWESYRRTKAPVYMGNTIEELAKNANLNPTTLVATIKEYNAAVKANTRQQLTPSNTLPKARLVQKAPFYAVPFQGGMTATFGGPLINTKGQVLNTENQPVKGLFAVGNAAGGLFYENYVGGAQLTSAAVFGCAVADFLKAKKG